MNGLRSWMGERTRAEQARGEAGRLAGTGWPGGGDDLRRKTGRHEQESDHPDGEP